MMFFFFNDTATTEIYTLSLHDALPIFAVPSWFSAAYPCRPTSVPVKKHIATITPTVPPMTASEPDPRRSEEHTSELQSRQYLVCRLLLEKKKRKTSSTTS